VGYNHVSLSSPRGMGLPTQVLLVALLTCGMAAGEPPRKASLSGQWGCRASYSWPFKYAQSINYNNPSLLSEPLLLVLFCSSVAKTRSLFLIAPLHMFAKFVKGKIITIIICHKILSAQNNIDNTLFCKTQITK
jgi:hypothetical protein